MKKIPLLFLSLLLVCSGLIQAEDSVSLSADNPAIRYVGLFTEDFKSSWTGSQIDVRFQGPSASVRLEVQAGKQVAFAVVVDGVAQLLIADAETKIYPVAEGLDPEVMHELILFRRSEAYFGVVKFEGFEFPAGTTVEKSADPSRRMLVIGDSITCGYGNMADDVSEGNTLKNENAWMAYAPLTARHFDADLVMLCWSGRGLYRNRSIQGDTEGTLPKLFDAILPGQASPLWDHSAYVPDVVVINLGTNDSTDRNGEKPTLSKEDYVNCYQDFIRRIRVTAPESTVFLTLGPMNNAPITLDWLEAAAAPFENVHPFLYKPLNGAEDIGGHYHPSLIKHEKMSEELIREINAQGLWQE
ncbi:GDSL-type esterase/lipase family protein [Kiritimatiellota bacterium B12222]|nr:GDSL-type esterase/lipase family protein [Kiritimatiellota bacterium B12222]